MEKVKKKEACICRNSLPPSVCIYVYKLSGSKKSKRNWTACISSGRCLAHCLLTLCHSPISSQPSATTPHIIRQTQTHTYQLPLSPACPRSQTHSMTHLLQKWFIQLRCATTFQTTRSYPSLILVEPRVKKRNRSNTVTSSD